MTFPGAPTLYYGDEVGLCGFTDPDNRRCYPWGKEDQELLEFHKKIIRIHKTHAALRTGSALDLRGSRNIISFARFNRKEQIIVVVNNDAYSRSITTEVWQTGVPKNTVLKQLLYSQSESTSLSPVEYAVNDGVFTITLPKYSSVILICENQKKSR
jgi:alpha-glucosidase